MQQQQQQHKPFFLVIWNFNINREDEENVSPFVGFFSREMTYCTSFYIHVKSIENDFV